MAISEYCYNVVTDPLSSVLARVNITASVLNKIVVEKLEPLTTTLSMNRLQLVKQILQNCTTLKADHPIC